MDTIQQCAENIARNVEAKYGFPWLTLLPIVIELIPKLVKCFQPDDAAQVKKYIDKRFNASNAGDKYGGYRKQLVVDVARRAKRAANEKNQSLSMDDAVKVAIETLNDIRNSDESKVGGTFASSYAKIGAGQVQD